MADEPTLGTSLSKVMQELTRIIEDGEDEEERGKALAQLRRAHRMLDVLVDETLKKNWPEYEAATNALGQANDALVAARKDIATVAEGLAKVAKALGQMVKLTEALASAIGRGSLGSAGRRRANQAVRHRTPATPRVSRASPRHRAAEGKRFACAFGPQAIGRLEEKGGGVWLISVRSTPGGRHVF